MCGIIGYTGHQVSKGILLDGLKRLEYRGYDSAGIAIIEKGEVLVHRSEGRISHLEKKLGKQEFSGSVGIGHTRWATHGAPTERNAHPHRVGSITLVHNGIIENYMELKQSLLSLGRTLSSDTDSELVAHLLDLEMSNGLNLKEAIQVIFSKLKGSYSFVILSDENPNLLAAVRNGPPLIVGLGADENFVASDVQAILHRTRDIYYMNDHEFAFIEKKGVKIFNSSGHESTMDVKKLNWTSDQMDKQGYKHFMLKEIHEESSALSNTIEGNMDHERGLISLGELQSAEALLKRVKRIMIVACGTAKHAALVGKYYIESFSKIPCEVDFASEFRYRNPVMGDDTLVLLISQSGETADTLAALKLAKENKIPNIAICNVRLSSLAREADYVLFTDAGPEIGVASTKAFSTQLCVLYMLGVHLGFLRDFLSEAQCKELTHWVLALPSLVEKVFSVEKKIEAISMELLNKTFFFYLSRGALYPIALEAALKLKEISYIHAEGYPAGELKHGPIALIDREAVSIVLCPQSHGDTSDIPGQDRRDLLYEKTMSNLQEVKARGGKLVVIGTEGDKILEAESHFFIGLPKVPWALEPILFSVPVQFLAYYMALGRGTDVDKPRNLAKSVTVE